MNYFPFHLGDYAAHTGHLEPMEDLAYRRLLDQYYIREGALPTDIQTTAKLVRMRSMAADVESVLREFFVPTEAGWRHERCEHEIARLKVGQRWVLDVTNAQWAEIRSLVFKRDKFACVYCGSTPERLECDHIFPLSKGGLSHPENLATSCVQCNRSKGAKTLEEWRGT